MTQFKWYQSGKIFGIRYMLKLGDTIPKHAHIEECFHNIIVLEGMVQLDFFGDDVLRVLGPGTVHDFDGSKKHMITGLSDYNVLLNLFLHGIPEGYAELPESEKSGYLPGEFT
jgi:hypothetical protein